MASAGPKLVIAVSGDPGSGKSTVCERLARELGLRRIYAGGITREFAAARGMELMEFERFEQTHPEFDREIDARLIAAAKEGDIVIEGRMAAWAVREAGVPALSIFITLAPEERIRRIREREACSREEAETLAEFRQTQLVERLEKIYGVKFTDRSLYDTVVDATGMDREEEYQAVLAAARAFFAL
jgi:predicted cytidylate kinase